MVLISIFLGGDFMVTHVIHFVVGLSVWYVRLWKDAGSQDILIEAEIVAAGSVSGVVIGHQ